MILKYEKSLEEVKEVEGKTEVSLSYDSVDKEVDADYVHICGHDTNPPTPCRREKIKK